MQNKRAIVVIRFYQTRRNKENGNDLEIYHMIWLMNTKYFSLHDVCNKLIILAVDNSNQHFCFCTSTMHIMVKSLKLSINVAIFWIIKHGKNDYLCNLRRNKTTRTVQSTWQKIRIHQFEKRSRYYVNISISLQNMFALLRRSIIL